MSITQELRKWAVNHKAELGMGQLCPSMLEQIADRIDERHKTMVDKAHADGEKSAMKQVRSKSVDYRKGYEQAMEDVDERTKTEQNGAITDELREWMRVVLTDDDPAHAIADRIEERHAEELERMWDEAEGADLKAFEATHVKLPVDADGVPINIGDKLDGYGQMHRVCQLRLYTDGSWSLLDEHGDVYYDMAGFAHVQPDTWERIIEDAMSAYLDDDSTAEPSKEELVERCRRLAER